MNATDLIGHLEDVQQIGPSCWQATCPVHGGQGSGLLVTAGTKGGCFIQCLQGCSTVAVLDALGVEIANLAPSQDDVESQAPVEDVVTEEPEPRPSFTSLDYEEIQRTIDNIRARAKGPEALAPHVVRYNVSAVVIGICNTFGTLVHDAGAAFALVDGRLVALEPGEQELVQLLDRFGLAPGDALTRDVLQDLRLAAFRDGQRVQVHISNHFDAETCTAHVLLRDGTALKLGPDGAQIVPNGHDDVFLRSPPGEELPSMSLPLPGLEHLDKLVHGFPFSNENNKAQALRTALLLWLMSAFIPEAMVDAPVLTLVGDVGAASSAARWIGRVLAGPAFEVVRPSSIKELDDLLCSTTILGLDLCRETPTRLVRRVVDSILSGIVLRTGRDSPSVPFRRRHPVIIAVDPHDPRLADLARAGVILEIEGRIPPEVARQAVAARDQVIAGILRLLGATLPVLHARQGNEFGLPTDFQTFLVEVHRVLWGEENTREILDAVSGRANMASDDPILRLIDRWVQTRGNLGRWVTTASLHQELNATARRYQLNYQCPNARSLGQRFRLLALTLTRRYGMQNKTLRSRVRAIRFTNTPTTSGNTTAISP